MLSWWAARALVCAFLEQISHSFHRSLDQPCHGFICLAHVKWTDRERTCAMTRFLCGHLCSLWSCKLFTPASGERVLTSLQVFLFPMCKPLLFCKPSYETSLHERGFSSIQKHEKTLKNIEWSSQVPSSFCGRQIQNWMFQHACIHVLICEFMITHMHATLHRRQHQTYLACNFTAFFAMFLCIRDGFVLDETISNAC